MFAPVLGAESEFSDQQSRGDEIAVDEFRAELDGETCEVALRMDTPADSITRFQHDDPPSSLTHITGCSQSSKTSADHYGSHQTPTLHITEMQGTS